MYIPSFNVMDDAEEIKALVAAAGSAQFVTVDDVGYPTATLLPVIWDGDRLVFHMARANPQWTHLQPEAPSLAIVAAADAYVSPAWYPSKAEDGRVVPTWNYSVVHFTGRAVVHHDTEWLREAVTRLTEEHEQRRAEPWAVDDAPEQYLQAQLRAIVGIEFMIERVEAKAKLSQNRSEADFAGVIAGLRSEGGSREHEVADSMAARRPPVAQNRPR